MRILIVSPAPPNTYHRIRLHHLIKALSHHELVGVFLVEPNTVSDPIKFEHYVFKKSFTASFKDSLLGLLDTTPLEVHYCQHHAMKNKVKELAAHCDLIIAKRLRAAQFLPDPCPIPVIIDSTDAMSMYYGEARHTVPFYKQPIFWEEWKSYQKYEQKVATKFKNWVVCSEVDATYLKNTLPQNSEIFVVPNVVDTEFYVSNCLLPNEPTLLFGGLMNKHVNTSAAYYFLDSIFPEIQAQVPRAKIKIVGPRPPRKLLSYQNDAIAVMGNVQDIRTEIESSRVVVVPVLVGSGTRNKILQAWSQSRPVVSSSIGAQGLDGTHGKELFIADDPEKFASVVVSLLNSAELAIRVGQAGRDLVEQRYSVQTMRDAYQSIIESVV